MNYARLTLHRVLALWSCSRADTISGFCAPPLTGGSGSQLESGLVTGTESKNYCRKRLICTTLNGATFFSAESMIASD